MKSAFALLVFASPTDGCNVVKLSGCFSSLATVGTDTSKLCPALTTAKTCAGDLITKCANDATASQILAGLKSYDSLCGGAGGDGCNVIKLTGCFSSLATVATDTSKLCPALTTVKTCAGDLITKCANDATASTILAGLKSYDSLCGGA